MKAINSGHEAGRKRRVPEGRSLGMSWFCSSLCPACPSLQCPGQVTRSPHGEPVGTALVTITPGRAGAARVPTVQCPESVLVLGNPGGKSQLLKTLHGDFSPGESNQEGGGARWDLGSSGGGDCGRELSLGWLSPCWGRERGRGSLRPPYPSPCASMAPCSSWFPSVAIEAGDVPLLPSPA